MAPLRDRRGANAEEQRRLLVVEQSVAVR